jgi:hypothetical protein
MSPCYKIYQQLYNSYTPKIDMNDSTAYMNYFLGRTKIDTSGVEVKVAAHRN